MERRRTSENLIVIRRWRMWTQGDLADRAGVSPTTVSGIENGKIDRPHFGTIRKLAGALGVSPEELVRGVSADESDEEHSSAGPLSLDWAMTAREEEFERELEEASLQSLGSLSRDLKEEQARLQGLYGEFSRGSEQRRSIKRRIRAVAAQSGSVEASITFHPGRKSPTA
jgi:transcriptional regulator with XRE-family HTH domain